MRDTSITRRRFVQGAAAGAAALGLGGRPAWAADVTGKPAAGPIGDFKLSLAQWSLHNAIFGRKGEKLDPLDFPRVAREQFGFDAVEFVNQCFQDKATDASYLRELKKRADDSGVTCVLIMVDREGDLSIPDKAKREQAVANHKKWIDAAAALGCHALRVNTGDHYSVTDVANAADACRQLAEHGDSCKVHVICENHGGPSSDPDALLALIKAVGKEGFGTLPDFANWPKDKDGRFTIDIYEAFARLMPHALGVSAKSYDFGPDGRETKLDYPRLLKIVTDAGYKGYLGVEYEGTRLSEPDGIRATKALIESLRGTMYRPA